MITSSESGVTISKEYSQGDPARLFIRVVEYVKVVQKAEA
jgi:hypothetical protein